MRVQGRQMAAHQPLRRRLVVSSLRAHYFYGPGIFRNYASRLKGAGAEEAAAILEIKAQEFEQIASALGLN